MDELDPLIEESGQVEYPRGIFVPGQATISSHLLSDVSWKIGLGGMTTTVQTIANQIFCCFLRRANTTIQAVGEVAERF